MTMAAHDSSARWKTFFLEAKETEIFTLLSKQSPTPTLSIPFHELQAFDPDFAEDILQFPRQILNTGKDTLREICRERGEDLDVILRVGELPRDSRRAIREIGSSDIEKLRSSDVQVIKISEIKPRMHIAAFQCEACGVTQEIIQNNERELIEPIRCLPTDQGGCGENAGRGGATRFNLVFNVSRLINNQWIEIQELPESVESGAQPGRAKVLLEGDLVNKHLPGQRIVANMIPVVYSEVIKNKKTPMFDIIYHLISSEHESVPFTEIKITDEEQEEILAISQREDLLRLMQNSIAPSIFSTGVMNFVKRSLALQLFGGVSRKNSDGTRTRGDIHILIMGDPGVAKSQLLTYVSELSPRGKFASGGGVSGAGLTAAAVRDTFADGRFSLEAGVLPLSDRGLAAIDEFDKISDDDRKVMHPAMEQQRIDISKGGITASLPSRCAIIAAANPKDGRFSNRAANTSVIRSFKETGLEAPLASRFDIIWMMRDEVKAENDEMIAKHILRSRTRGVPEALIDEFVAMDPVEEDKEQIIKEGVDGTEHLSQSFLRKYIAFAKRNYHPNIDQDVMALILEYYVQERQSYGREDSDEGGESNVVPITARALEALIRLTEAHARMFLREDATAEDAKVALAVFKHWREESGIEDESEFSGTSVKQRNISVIVKNLIRDICTENGNVATISAIYNRALAKKIDESTVDRIIQQMRTSGILFQPKNDEYSFA
ncbi:minichromosome maintenance protein MCM [Euryarchaeota archaeon]|nr:minichromosome maintenance protein MCM [Euryarchaeota archaeon]MDC0555240.1 minichromosome maintenance protein MCM [Euryarchaeota archaeon]